MARVKYHVIRIQNGYKLGENAYQSLQNQTKITDEPIFIFGFSQKYRTCLKLSTREIAHTRFQDFCVIIILHLPVSSSVNPAPSLHLCLLKQFMTCNIVCLRIHDQQRLKHTDSGVGLYIPFHFTEMIFPLVIISSAINTFTFCYTLHSYYYFVPTVAALLVLLLVPSRQSQRHKDSRDVKSGASSEYSTKVTKRD